MQSWRCWTVNGERRSCVWPVATTSTQPNPLQPQPQSSNPRILCVLAHPSLRPRGHWTGDELCVPTVFPIQLLTRQISRSLHLVPYLAAELARCRVRLPSSPSPSPSPSPRSLQSRIRQRNKAWATGFGFGSGRAARCKSHLCPSLSPLLVWQNIHSLLLQGCATFSGDDRNCGNTNFPTSRVSPQVCQQMSNGPHSMAWQGKARQGRAGQGRALPGP
jgi:hypothetical protein